MSVQKPTLVSLVFQILGKAALGFVVFVIGFLIYAYYRPDLLIDPINRVLYLAPMGEKVAWHTDDIALTPDFLQIGESKEAVVSRLRQAGFRLWRDHTANPGDYYDRSYLDRGITHTFEHPGRAGPVCVGQAFFIEIGIVNNALVRATGHTNWTYC